MIYLDVTSACQSALNTGVKRIQRGWHGYLAGRTDYVPVCWQSVRQTYRTLKPSDTILLEQGASCKVTGLARHDSFLPGLIPDLLCLRLDKRYQLVWPHTLGPDDVILLPDLFWDNRGAYWKRMGLLPARRIGVFHDAIALRRPGQSRVDAYFCARGIRALGQMDAVICISEEAQQDLQLYWKQFGVKPITTKVLPWPVPFARPLLSPPSFPAKKLLYVARLEPHKNHLCLLEACERLWREGLAFELRLIGCLAYPGAARLILRKVNSLREAGHQVRWDAQVSESELHQAYQDCSFTVFPSLLEGFGLPILESLAHGRPVVCGTEGAIGEVTRGGGCEQVDPANIESLANGLSHLLTDEASYLQLYSEIQQRPFRSWDDYWNDLSGWLDIS